MRNVVAALGRRSRRLAVIDTAAIRGEYTILCKCLLTGGHENAEGTQRHYRLPQLLHRNSYSTGFTSVQGERTSAEYAKIRKKVLEKELRAAIISFHVLKFNFWVLFDKDIKKRSVKFRETLIHLGSFYVKLGQALSTRPDVLPCTESLQNCRSIESQLGAPISMIFADISPEPIAAASLGQLIAHLQSGELVAVKVQRPGMSLKLTLDPLLFNMVGGQLKDL